MKTVKSIPALGLILGLVLGLATVPATASDRVLLRDGTLLSLGSGHYAELLPAGQDAVAADQDVFTLDVEVSGEHRRLLVPATSLPGAPVQPLLISSPGSRGAWVVWTSLGDSSQWQLMASFFDGVQFEAPRLVLDENGGLPRFALAAEKSGQGDDRQIVHVTWRTLEHSPWASRYFAFSLTDLGLEAMDAPLTLDDWADSSMAAGQIDGVNARAYEIGPGASPSSVTMALPSTRDGYFLTMTSRLVPRDEDDDARAHIVPTGLLSDAATPGVPETDGTAQTHCGFVLLSDPAREASSVIELCRAGQWAAQAAPSELVAIEVARDGTAAAAVTSRDGTLSYRLSTPQGWEHDTLLPSELALDEARGLVHRLVNP